MEDPSSSSSRVVAVYSTKDTSSEPCQQLGNLVLSNTGLSTARNLRQSLSKSETFSSLPTSYVFLTSDGWEVSESAEETITIHSVVCDGNIVKLRTRYTSQQRVGMIYEKIPLCTVFLQDGDFGGSLRDLRKVFATQHPVLYDTVMIEEQALFLDVNGWPVMYNQESELQLIVALYNNTVHLTKPVFRVASVSPSQEEAKPPLTPQQVVRPNEDTIHRSPPSPKVMVKSPSFVRKSQELPEIMVSYVHKEASGPAARLSEELTKLGYSVFLDKNIIKAGDDWQDVLNEAVCNCRLFLPIVTPLYGLTEWTNKEVKLADILGKFIIPVTFLPKWPPMCLAIQFATTQYIKWHTSSDGTHLALNTVVNTVAAEISDQYTTMKVMIKEKEEEEREGEEDEGKKAKETIAMKSDTKEKKLSSKLASLPRSLPDMIRKSIFKQDKSLIVMSYHPSQLEFVEGVRHDLESRGFEVWASMAGDNLQKREVFMKKVNVAGVVVFVLSQEYATSSSCEQEMYYVEGRKRVIPIIVNSFQIPGWMTTLIGPDNFLDSRSPNFQEVFMEEVECATVPAKAEGRLRKLVEQKTKLHKLCTDLKKNLPKGKLVYVTGGTKVSTTNNIAICQEFGKLLANQLDCVLITGGFYGVGEAVGKSFYKERQELEKPEGVIHIQATKDPQDHTMQARQNSDGCFLPVPYGVTHFYCDTVRQRDMLIAKVIDLCILIEGGPSAAFEAHQFSWSGHTVVPVVSTGGAASGKFNAPPGIFYKPHYVNDSDWSILSDSAATPSNVGAALVNIVNGHTQL